MTARPATTRSPRPSTAPEETTAAPATGNWHQLPPEITAAAAELLVGEPLAAFATLPTTQRRGSSYRQVRSAWWASTAVAVHLDASRPLTTLSPAQLRPAGEWTIRATLRRLATSAAVETKLWTRSAPTETPLAAARADSPRQLLPVGLRSRFAGPVTGGSFERSYDDGTQQQAVALCGVHGGLVTIVCAWRGPAAPGTIEREPWHSRLLETTIEATTYHQLFAAAPPPPGPSGPTAAAATSVGGRRRNNNPSPAVPNGPAQAPRNIWGTAGRSLAAAAGTYGDRSHVGRWGEVSTAAVLEQAYQGGPTHVFHDLDIPGYEGGPNVDHIVARGNRLVIVDSKVWAPGFYWTIGSRTRRGIHRFDPAEKRGVGLAVDNYRRLFAGRAGVGGMLAIHPPRQGTTRIWAMSLPDGVERVMVPDLIAALEGRLGPHQPPGPHIVETLRSYVRANQHSQAPAGWHQDPTARHELRYWDGTNWTEWVSNRGDITIG